MVFLLAIQWLSGQGKNGEYYLQLIEENPKHFEFYFAYFEISNSFDNFDIVEPLALEGLELAGQQADVVYQQKFLSALGNLYYHQNMHGKALVYYQKLLENNESNSSTSQPLAGIFAKMGMIYLKWEDLRVAEEYFKNAYERFLRNNDSLQIAHCLNSLGLINLDQKKYHDAKKNYLSALEYTEIISELSLTIESLIGLGRVDCALEDYDSSIEFFDEALHLSRNSNDTHLLARVHLEKGKSYLKNNNLKLAHENINKAMSLAKKNHFSDIKMDCLSNLSIINQINGESQKASQQFNLYSHLRDSFHNSDEHNKIMELRARYEFLQQEKDLQKHNRELEIVRKQEEITNLKLLFLSGSFLLLVAIGWIASKRLRSRYREGKKKIELDEKVYQSKRSLMQAEMMNSQLEKLQLNDALDHKNNELSQFARNKAEQGEIIADFVSKLKDIKQLPDTDKKNAINKLIRDLDNKQKNSKELNEFHAYIDEVNANFVSTLENKFPKLSKNERKLAIFLRLGLSTKEMASLQNVSIKAIEMARYRLRKKLDLQNELSLNDFFQTI